MAWQERTPNGGHRGVYRTADGKGKRSKSGFKYAGAALAWAEQAEAVELGLAPPPDVEPGGVTFGDYALQWIARRTGKAPATVEKYRSSVVGIVEHAPFADRPINRVTTADVEAWFAAMDADGSGVGVATRNYRMGRLRAIFKQARVVDKIRTDDGVIIDDPTATLTAARQRRGRRKRLFLTDAEVAAMLDAARRLDDTGTDYLVALLGVDAGLRWSEIAALSIDDIHLDDNDPYLDIWRSVVRKTGEIQETTKNGEPRPVPIGSALLADALRQRVGDVELLNGPGALLLPRRMTDPRPLAYSTCENRFAAIVEASGIVRKPIGWHDFRHTYGSRLAARNVDVAIIAEVLGHSQLEVTRRYIHASGTAVRHREVTRALSTRERGR